MVRIVLGINQDEFPKFLKVEKNLHSLFGWDKTLAGGEYPLLVVKALVWPMQPENPISDPRGEREELLKLRLKKTQCEAEAARLTAVATEIEILLKTLRTGDGDRVAANSAAESSGWAPYVAAAENHLSDLPKGSGREGAWRADWVAIPKIAKERGAASWADEEGDEEETDAQHVSENRVETPAVEEYSATESTESTESTAEKSDPIVVDSDAEPDAEQRPRRSLPAWLISVAAHLILLACLMLVTFHTAPRDAIALAASTAAREELALETMTFESTESPETPSSSESAVDVTVDDLGERAAAVQALENSLAGQGPSEATLENFASDFSQVMTFSGASAAAGEAATVFCGIEGGGNNFCYIVDSSQSMKNGRFEAARDELLRSIDALPVDKRFYVIFYDSNLDPMRFDGRSEREPFAVPATIENKASLRRWAMTVDLERGAPPDDALELALELEPDVIFLLTDGEFPQYIETLLAEKNRVQSLFGDEGPKSIIHTIGFHSRDGESRLMRIAERNGGRYQYIADLP